MTVSTGDATFRCVRLAEPRGGRREGPALGREGETARSTGLPEWRHRQKLGPSHSRSRSTLAGSGSAGALSRISLSSSFGVPRPASTPPPYGRRRVPIPSSRSARPRATAAWPQTEFEPAAEHVTPPEPLSPAETRVLRYLPTLLSLREIGDEFYLSVNTIKVHVRHIYAKLEVHSRRGAVERARALGLL
ncbi:MAG: LuxR family transcriptional regulator, maltose regulon positive regulatory protein [Solirubrobacteraceae bacterium]|nr:LuxR family transcriptional regulator, maltose regulon positive regulatory protein [Solirubrobacteraceae bacterium]